MLNEEWLKAFAGIGILRDGEWNALGAGVFIHIPPTVWFATAEHVIKSAGNQDIAIVVSRKGGGLVPINISEIHRSSGLGWISESLNDVAVGLVPIFPEADFKAISRDYCALQSQLVASMTAYTVGCPYGLTGFDPQKAHPLVLAGVIAGASPDEKKVYCTAPTFPGNSGGPLLVEHPPYTPEGNLMVGAKTLLLAGLVRELALVRSDEHPSLPALHLGICTSIDAVLDLIKSGAASDQLEKIGIPRNP